MTPYRWLLFDADDTIFDFVTAEEHFLSRTFLHYGVEPTQERKDRYRAINLAMWRAFDRGEITQEKLVVERYRLFLEQEGIDGNAEEWNSFGLRCLSEDPVMLPGADALCHALAQRYTLALVTNGVPFVQRGRMERSPVKDCFGARIYISGEMGCRKPQREYFDRVLSDLGGDSHRDKVLVIGDSLSSDIRGAVDSGLDCVWLNPKRAPAGDIRPTWDLSCLDQLAELLL